MQIINFTKKNIALLLILITGAVCGIIGGALFAVTEDLPQIRSLETYTPPSVTRIYSSDKVLLAELFVEKRDPVPLDVMPVFLKKAIIATEDRNYYKHCGIDIKGIIRASIRDILAGEFVEGASTITQQLAKTLFLTSEKSLVRKLKEAVLAFQLERRYTKDEILELYLNQVYFGSGAYGVESASRIFFNRSVKDLGLAQCALIAGMPKAPSAYSPLVNKDLAIKRKNTVLMQMHNTGMIDKKEYKKALNERLEFNKRAGKLTKAPYFVEYIKKSLEEAIGSSMLYKGGLTIYTTLSYKLQKAAEDAVANGLSALEKRMEQNNIKNGNPQCALVSLEVQTGGVLSMIGGRDFYESSFNRAVEARRQPGSAFKPIVYAYAIKQGFSQNKMILDAPVAFKNVNRGKDWEPENFSKNFMGEITLRKALSLSKNIPSVRLIEMLGPASVAEFGYALGIESRLEPNLSLALGTSEVTLINLTSAYAVFANKGNRIRPFGVTEVIGNKGRIVWQVKPKKQAVMSRAGASIVTDMLQGVIKEGTGKKARVIGRPVAGKTGTTNNYKDALFIGFSPSIATGVWVGQDRPVTLGKLETGARAALPIWIEFMTHALFDRQCQYFDIPDDVVKIRMDPITGQLASDNSSGSVAALFIKGKEPGR